MAELQVFEVPEPVHKQQTVVLEKAQKSGKIKIGVNETTKAVERGTAKLVVIAKDTDPKELVMHLPIICKEKNIAFSFANTKKDLGETAGIHVGTAALAVTNEGDAKKDMEDLQKKLSDLAKKE